MLTNGSASSDVVCKVVYTVAISDSSVCRVIRDYKTQSLHSPKKLNAKI